MTSTLERLIAAVRELDLAVAAHEASTCTRAVVEARRLTCEAGHDHGGVRS